MSSFEERTLGEVVRTLTRMEETLDAMRTELLPREMHNVQLAALSERMDRIERDAELDRTRTRTAWRTALTSFLAPIVVAVVLAWMIGKP